MSAILITMVASGLTVSTVYLVYKLSIRSFEKLETQYKTLADALGVQAIVTEKKFSMLKSPFPKLEGTVDGKDFKQYMYVVGSGKNQRTYTAFEIETNNRYSYTLKMFQEGFFSKFGKKLGMQDIQIGVEEFDKKFIIRSNDDYFIRGLFSESLQSHCLQNVHHVNGSFKLKKNVVRYDEMTSITKASKRESFEQLVYLASAFSDEVSRFSDEHKPEGI